MPLCEVLPTDEINRYELIFDSEADSIMRNVWMEKLIDANRNPETTHLWQFDGLVVMRPEEDNFTATCDHPYYIVGELESYYRKTDKVINELMSQTPSVESNDALTLRAELGKSAMLLAEQIKTDFAVLEIASLEYAHGLEFTTDCFRAELHIGIQG